MSGKLSASMDPFSLGNLLISHGIMNDVDLKEALDFADKHGIRLGEALIELGQITDGMLDTLLAHQKLEREKPSHKKTRSAAAMTVAATACATTLYARIDDLTNSLNRIINTFPAGQA